MPQSKKNNFLKHFAVIGFGTALNMLLGLLTTPLITRIVSPNEYGQLSIFSMYSSIAVMVLCMGLDQTLVRYYYEKEDIGYKRALLFRCVKLPVIISILLSVIFTLLVYFRIINFEFNTIIVVFLCIYTIIQLIYRFSLLLVRLAYQSKLYSILNILHKILYIIVALPLIVFISKEQFFLLVIATIISAFICMVVSICIQKEIWNYFKNNDEKCHITKKEIYSYGLPFIISMGLTTIFQAIDKISLNKYCSYSEVGIYASTMSIVNIFAIIQSTFNTLWLPMATEHYTNNKNDCTFYHQGNQIITVIMFFCGISLMLCKDIFAILLGEKYREAAHILPFLIFHPIMYTISETTVLGIVFMKKSKMQILVAAISCLANVIGNMYLVPMYGCQGAAISTGISYIIFFTMRTVISNRYFYIDFKLKRFYLLTIIVVVYAFYNTFFEFNINAIIGYLICLTALCILYRDTIIYGIKYLYAHRNKILNRKIKN